MVQPVNIDFGLLKPPNYLGDAVNAFQVGRTLGAQTAQQNARQAAGQGALAARLAAMSPAQRAVAGRQAELFLAIGTGLRALPYAARAPVLAHMAPALQRRGLDAGAVRRFDPTDAALDAQMAGLAAVRALITGRAANAFNPRAAVPNAAVLGGSGANTDPAAGGAEPAVPA